MIDNKKCYVRLENVPDSERVIFKLICSVSSRTKGRQIQYALVSGNDAGKAHLLIQGMQTESSNMMRNASGYRVELNETGVSKECDVFRELTKPLIATRVLSALDEFVSETQLIGAQEETNRLIAELNDVKLPVGHEEALENVEDTTSFDISEQEASELAIVDDESLANPANINNEPYSRVTTAGVTPIRVKEKIDQYELEMSSISEINNTAIHTQITQRALVVDDSPSVRKQLELELELFDVDVDYVATANEAMEMLKRENYDVAFLDVVLPDNDGFSICRHIKETAKATSVIMLTGKAKQSDKVKGALAGCDAYMVKPVGRLTFQTTVRNYLTLIDASSAMQM